MLTQNQKVSIQQNSAKHKSANLVIFSAWPFLITWAYILFVMVIFSTLYLFMGIVTKVASVKIFWISNFKANQNWSRKILRLMDTLASILVLTGMVIGFASMFNDQYDIVLEADGSLRDFNDVVNKFGDQMYELERDIKKEINKITLTCEEKQAFIGGTLAASFIPYFSSLAKIGSKAARLIIRTSDQIIKLLR